MKHHADQHFTDNVAQNQRLRREIVQLGRYAVKGDTERAKIQLVRLIRSLRAEGDALADVLQESAFTNSEAAPEAATRAVRRGEPVALDAPPPMDSETRLEILRVEDPPQLSAPLVFSASLTKTLARVVSERRASSRLEKAGLFPAKSLLFIGPPGVGKTMAARQIAANLGVPLFIVDLAALISSLLGRTGNNLKQAFAFAQHRPCVLLLDEIDAIGKRRSDESDIGELKRLVTVLLQELDLWSGKNLLIAATNHPELLDPALSRRFDETVRFPPPTKNQLIELAHALMVGAESLPIEWCVLLASIDHRQSHGEFVRDLNRLRRAYILGGKSEAVQVIESILAVDGNASIEDRKRLGIFLHQHGGQSQRQAAAIAGLARETLRTALKEETAHGE